MITMLRPISFGMGRRDDDVRRAREAQGAARQQQYSAELQRFLQQEALSANGELPAMTYGELLDVVRRLEDPLESAIYRECFKPSAPGPDAAAAYRTGVFSKERKALKAHQRTEGKTKENNTRLLVRALGQLKQQGLIASDYARDAQEMWYYTR